VVSLPDDAVRALDRVSALESNESDHFFDSTLQRMVNGGTRVAKTVF
jgi:hypothetical protein